MLEKGDTGPVIFILTGMGCSFDEWHEITETLCKTYKVIMYHRPGLGRSELKEEKRNTAAAVQDLYSLINYYKITSSFYLVGHSYGGLCAQHFAKKYPELVKGMVLVDSTSVDLKLLDELDLPVMNKESDEVWIEKCHQYALKTKAELNEILMPTLQGKHKEFPESIQQRLLEFDNNPLLYKAMASEIQHWKEDAEYIKRLGVFPDIPLVVIGRDKEYAIDSERGGEIPQWELRRFEDKWEGLITEQANLSPKGHLIFASRSGHSIYLDRPDIVIDSIQRMVSVEKEMRLE
ncbi:alpha/beta fold hydrolase [Bacillus sp. SG-1]|uniref:alpha/beta fold hydrolase n=1 Tax=Bacillus sp. SG-1 TaxID=161544 RepID=UPI000154500B|nr:alpha/beta hydrolase [Bacillus sp. SG-1]EDL64534.1 hydrolase, alpha/beta fold family protein [Bacillus sp. SG-1]